MTPLTPAERKTLIDSGSFSPAELDKVLKDIGNDKEHLLAFRAVYLPTTIKIKVSNLSGNR